MNQSVSESSSNTPIPQPNEQKSFFSFQQKPQVKEISLSHSNSESRRNSYNSRLESKVQSPKKNQDQSVRMIDVAEQLQNLRKNIPRKSVLFTQDLDFQKFDKVQKNTKKAINKSRNSLIPTLQQLTATSDFDPELENYLNQKKKLLQEMDKLELLDKVNPLQNSLVQTEQKRSIKIQHKNMKKQLRQIETRNQIIQDQKSQFDKQENQTRRYHNFSSSEFKINTEPNDEQKIAQMEKAQDFTPKLRKQGQSLQLIEKQSIFKRQGVIDLEKESPNNIIEFSPVDYQFLKEAKQKQLRNAEEDLLQVKTQENRDRIGLNQELRVKWDRVRKKIRMIGRMKMLFDEVKLYGTSFRVETSEKRKEVIDELECILKQGIGMIENNKNSKIKMGLLIHPNSKIKFYWSFVLIMLLIYTAFITPVKLTFVDDDDLTWSIFEGMVDAFFLIDILLTFNSSYYTENGEIVISRRKIILQYMKTWFLLDLIAIFPFYLLNSENESQSVDGIEDYFKLTRLPRLYKLIKMARLFKMIKKASYNKYAESIEEYLQLNAGLFRVITFFCTVLVCVHMMTWFFLFFYLHNFFYSLFYYAAKIKNFGPNTWVYELGLVDDDKVTIYITSMYWTVATIATVGFGDVRAFNDLERLISIIWMILGAGFYSFTVGSLSSILSALDTKHAHLQNKITITDEFCKETFLSKDIRDKIRKALEYTAMKSIFSKEQRDKILKEIPNNLKFKIAEAMYSELRTKVPFFKRKEQMFLANFVTVLQPLKMQMGEIIYQKGEHPILVYFLVGGRVNMVIGMHWITFKTYVQGSYFGEVEIFDASPRLHTARAEIECDLLIISQVDFLNILSQYPDYYQEVKDTSLEKLRRENEAIIKMQKIANLSYKSAFWQKGRNKNFYQAVKEREEMEMIQIDSISSISSDEMHQSLQSNSIFSKRSGKSKRSFFMESRKKRFDELRRRLTQKGQIGLVPVDYKHSLIPNLQGDEEKESALNQNIKFRQDFKIPTYHKNRDPKKYIQIKVSQFNQEEDYQQNNLSFGSVKSLEVMPKIELDELDNVARDQNQSMEIRTYSERFLKVPQTRLAVHQILKKSNDNQQEQIRDSEKVPFQRSNFKKLSLEIKESYNAIHNANQFDKPLSKNEQEINSLSESLKIIVQSLQKLKQKQSLKQLINRETQTEEQSEQSSHFEDSNFSFREDTKQEEKQKPINPLKKPFEDIDRTAVTKRLLNIYKKQTTHDLDE